MIVASIGDGFDVMARNDTGGEGTMMVAVMIPDDCSIVIAIALST